jgi:hypothetical protein
VSTTQTAQRRGVRIAAVAGIVALIGIVLGTAWALNGKEDEVATTAPTQTVTKEQLRDAAQARVFFGHQSVGANLVDGIPGVYQAAGLDAPTVTTDPKSTSDGFFGHGYIGENGDPLGKIADFDAIMRGGMADKVDVAAMKLCWVDFNSSTDVDAVFAAYQKTMDGLARDFPDVTFLYVTTPLTTESSGAKAWIKGVLGRDSNSADNVIREKYNGLMRQAYGDTGRLYDLAHLQSTAPDGTHVSGEYKGAPYLALAPEWASDPGHLNAAGSQMVAGAFLKLVAVQPSSR